MHFDFHSFILLLYYLFFLFLAYYCNGEIKKSGIISLPNQLIKVKIKDTNDDNKLKFLITSYQSHNKYGLCEKGQFQCLNNGFTRCINTTCRCDGFNNCGDKRDESWTFANCFFCLTLDPIQFAVLISIFVLFLIGISIIVCLCCLGGESQRTIVNRNQFMISFNSVF